jgi:hypothetical protein
MDFKDDEPALALYIHHDMVPLKFQSPDDDLSYKNLLEVINVSIVQIQLLWGERATFIIE